MLLVNGNKSSVLIYKETILLPVGIYLLKVKNIDTRNQCKICSKLTKKYTRTTSIDMNIELVDIALVSFFLALIIILLLVLLLVISTFNLLMFPRNLLICADNHVIFN